MIRVKFLAQKSDKLFVNRTTKKKKPMLLLHKSHKILAGNGKVEAWGKSPHAFKRTACTFSTLIRFGTELVRGPIFQVSEP